MRFSELKLACLYLCKALIYFGFNVAAVRSLGLKLGMLRLESLLFVDKLCSLVYPRR